ncbi:Cof-type HAD-IIB family hydrolase [uncultured Holdemanella sp.]|uniref:Cof-type HAD-IIB family hydrolase n=1 Tax=uncultured Holdemanella sp. TaxID=1763549 RepID=UPI0025D8EB14|nr:Cof-type HAD-IIB family hydrolase [uncultured Holdemanella sp.]
MKLIFLDADGTLFHHEGYIPDSAIDACIQAQKNGHKIILCTGRQRIEIFGDMLKIDYDAIIAGSGATIECDHKIIEENSFTKEESQYLTKYLLDRNIPANFESSTKIYANQFTKDTMLKMVEEQCKGKSEEEKAKHGLTILTSQITVVDRIDDLIYNKVSVIDNGKTLFKNIKDDLSDKYDVIPATFAPLGKESGEIGSYHITKATGMDSIIRYFNANIEDTIALGDGFNDLPMFNKAHLSIAMGNAPQAIKDKADIVTTSLDEDGVYNAFKQLKLI